jgi:hypothetical protein
MGDHKKRCWPKSILVAGFHKPFKQGHGFREFLQNSANSLSRTLDAGVFREGSGFSME